jgi:meso-butanediol dehydrogenase/(S,S)-butanediol dehydrogenase/diacetyl reductase
LTKGAVGDGRAFFFKRAGVKTMHDFSGKVAIVTGSGRQGGLGAAIAARLAEGGAKLVIHDRGESPGADAAQLGSPREIAAVVAAIAARGGTAAGCAADLLAEADCERLVAFALETFGRLDFLINNAGVGFLFSPLLETRAEDWDRVLGVNLRGAFLMIKHAGRQMVAQGTGGRIVSIASVAAKRGRPRVGAYAASKHGLIGLTRVAAAELAPHAITVNAVCPNHVTTQLGAWQNDYMAKSRGQDIDTYLAEMRARIPLGRVGLVEDTARAVAFLCSDEAAYITAEAMNVSGGEEYH